MKQIWQACKTSLKHGLKYSALRLEVDPELGEVASGLWGASPCPFAVNVATETLEQTPPPYADGMPGYRVKVTRYISSSAPVNSDVSRIWEPDYEAIALYQPSQSSYTALLPPRLGFDVLAYLRRGGHAGRSAES